MRYKITEDLMASDLKSGRSKGSLKFKPFKEGDIVVGQDYKPKVSGSVRVIPSIIVEERYIIPNSKVDQMSDETSDEKDIKTRSGYFAKGAIAGAGVGLAGALIWRKYHIWLVVGGGLLGGYLGHELSNTATTKNKIILSNKNKDS